MATIFVAMHLSLEARRRFWEGVQDQVVQWRQPAKTLALAEKTRKWMGGQHEWLGSMSTGLAVSTAVFRPQVHELGCGVMMSIMLAA